MFGEEFSFYSQEATMTTYDVSDTILISHTAYHLSHQVEEVGALYSATTSRM
jgi:hypothetical protein